MMLVGLLMTTLAIAAPPSSAEGSCRVNCADVEQKIEATYNRVEKTATCIGNVGLALSVFGDASVAYCTQPGSDGPAKPRA